MAQIEQKRNQNKAARPASEVVAITGASNALGRGLMKAMLDDGRYKKIVAIDVKRPELEDPRVIFHRVDLTLPHASRLITKVFGQEGVDTLVHLVFTYSAVRSSSIAHEMEAIGIMHLLDAAAESDLRKVILRSTTLVYGASKKNPGFLTEEHPLVSATRQSFVGDKVESEKQVKQYSEQHPEVTVSILRDGISVGASASNFFLNMIRRKVAPVVMGYNPLMQFLHETDRIRAYKKVVDEDHPGVYNIVSKGVIRYKDVLAKCYCARLPLPERAIKSSFSLLWAMQIYDVPSAFVRYVKYAFLADGSKAELEMGFTPQFTSEEAIADFAAHKRNRAKEKEG
jgi:UDP-glucose 4-epimerase